MQGIQSLLSVSLFLVSFFFIVAKDYKAIRSILVTVLITKFIPKKISQSLLIILWNVSQKTPKLIYLFLTKSFWDMKWKIIGLYTSQNFVGVLHILTIFWSSIFLSTFPFLSEKSRYIFEKRHAKNMKFQSSSLCFWKLIFLIEGLSIFIWFSL